MIHARDDYNRIQDPAGLIPADEPVFLLRAQDKLAAGAVRHWAQSLHLIAHEYAAEDNRVDSRAAQDMALLAEAHADAMERYAETGQSKTPDMPKVPR